MIPLLLRYHWPGNIRELRNVLERIVIFNDGEEVGVQDLPGGLVETAASPDDTKKTPSEALQRSKSLETLQQEKNVLEEQRIRQALKETYGNKSAAARMLGISRAGLYQKIRRYNIQ